MSQVKHPVMLIVLDGWGHSDSTEFNAIHAANTPHWDALVAQFPNTLIRCSGGDVGLPAAQMGNSEVGHMHLGAGRTVPQDFTRITAAADNGEIGKNENLRPAFTHAANCGNAVHLLGLLSPGGVHSHEQHIAALITAAAETGVERIYVHAFLDGRDTPPKSAGGSIEFIEDTCREIGHGRIASVVGRYYAMDRNKNWERTEAAYHLVVNGEADYRSASAQLALEAAYARDESDEFVVATSITSGNENVTIEDGDVVVFANFRADRARQLTQAMTEPAFEHFTRRRRPELHAFITMTDYGAQFDLPVAFPPFDLENTYGSWISAHGLKQLRIAETEKYAHVTFFFNGGVEEPTTGEERCLVPSPDVATYDLKPEMNAAEVTDELVDAIQSRRFDTIICNYANADMVGHTGVFDATVKCIETLDACLGRVIDAAQATGMEVLITADHGNAEKMRDGNDEATSQPHTAHTSNVVPLIYIGRAAELSSGCLSDIAPTMLHLLGLDIPAEMDGNILVTLKDSDSQNAA